MYKFVGNRIKQAREEKGISQKKLGLILGLSDKAISAYEASRTYPPLETLFKLSTELNKPIFFFLTEEENELFITDTISKIETQLEDINKNLKLVQDQLKKK